MSRDTFIQAYKAVSTFTLLTDCLSVWKYLRLSNKENNLIRETLLTQKSIPRKVFWSISEISYFYKSHVDDFRSLDTRHRHKSHHMLHRTAPGSLRCMQLRLNPALPPTTLPSIHPFNHPSIHVSVDPGNSQPSSMLNHWAVYGCAMHNSPCTRGTLVLTNHYQDIGTHTVHSVRLNYSIAG